MSFTNPAPGAGFYVTGDLIDESQINYWCSILPDCIDGAGGGTYSLSAPLIIENDDVEIEFLIVSNSLSVVGASALNSLTATNATLSGNVQLGDSSGDTLQVVATAQFDNNVTLGASVADITTLKGLLTYSTSGRILETGKNVITTSSNVNATDFRNIVLSTAIGGTTTTTLTGTAVDGDWFVLMNLSGANQNIAGLITYNNMPTASGIKMVLISGTWVTTSSWTD